MKLYDYLRSTACYRVRIALQLKNINYEKLPIHLVNQGGEQFSPTYLEINPQSLVPALSSNNQILTQSLAIIEYLDELVPEPPLLPENALDRAQVRSLALSIACDIHPLNNLRVTAYLKNQFDADTQQVEDWYFHWLKLGFDAIEKKLRTLNSKPSFCYGKTITLADLCLIPQVYNANRFAFPMDDYPLICSINENCLENNAFKAAKPGI